MISTLIGGRPVRIVDEWLQVFDVELGERTGLLKVLLPYLPLVTVAFFSRRAGEEQHREFVEKWREEHHEAGNK